ncbi:MAG: GNAT family N-acetyltransferase [Cyclobacteriaceae bacterium]
MNPILLTHRLRLTPFTLADQELMHQTFTDPFVRKFLWDDEVISEEQTREILEQNDHHFQNDHWGLWKISYKEEADYLGFAGLWSFFAEPQPQLLYGLLPSATRQGYATEASRMIITYAFEELGFSYLIASCDAPHTASRRVAERLGMHFVEERTEQGKPTAFFRLERH